MSETPISNPAAEQSNEVRISGVTLTPVDELPDRDDSPNRTDWSMVVGFMTANPGQWYRIGDAPEGARGTLSGKDNVETTMRGGVPHARFKA